MAVIVAAPAVKPLIIVDTLLPTWIPATVHSETSTETTPQSCVLHTRTMSSTSTARSRR